MRYEPFRHPHGYRRNDSRHYKSRLLGRLALTFCVFVILFAVSHPLFLLANSSSFPDITPVHYKDVIIHGLPMDMSVAGYLTAIPALLLLASIWIHPTVVRWLQTVYFRIVAVLLPFIFILDACLYSYWGFRLDTTPFFYFISSPHDALASVPLTTLAVGLLLWCLLAFLLDRLFSRCLVGVPELSGYRDSRLVPSVLLLVCMGCLFVVIRGGVTTSTMNVGRVYFTTDAHLNHAAVNPCFSLLSSLVSSTDFSQQYRLMPDEQADKIVSSLLEPKTGHRAADIYPLLRKRRPNIVVVVLESFSAHVMSALGGPKGVTPRLDRMTHQGIFFKNFYANSFRTDRGLVSIFAGYPSQPNMSLMKYPAKTERLPMFPSVLRDAGYHLTYYYGGDADFTNMRSFLTSAGFTQIVSDVDFPVQERLSKWGAPDGLVFDRALSDIRNMGSGPWLKVIQTSSSHEPFDVPYQRLKDPVLNAFAYTDAMLGQFMDGLRRLPAWDNTLVVIVPDHLGAYPKDIDNYAFERYHIPMLWMGGAIVRPIEVRHIGSQIDIAATLLSQLHLPHDRFIFSKDMMNPASPHFAYCSFPNAAAIITDSSSVMVDLETRRIIHGKGVGRDKTQRQAEAYVQKIFDDIARR